MDKITLRSLLIPIDTTIKQAIQKLNITSKKILFVKDEQNTILGTVTDGDIRRGIIKGFGFNDKVKEIMCVHFTSVSSAILDIKSEAKRLMVKNEIDQIPVLNEVNELVDIIFWTDILDNSKDTSSKEIFTNQVVIMAGGKGSRLDPFTKILPKPLIPIGNKTIIELIMDRFFHCGFNNFIYTLNYKKEYIKLFLSENNFQYVIDWIEEKDFLGTAGALSLLKNKICDTFFITNCDSIIDGIDFKEVLKWHKESNASITIIGCHNEVKIPFGVLELLDGRLTKILEKPIHDVIINTGVYVMEPHVISYINDGELMDMNTLIDKVAARDKVTVFPIYHGWMDIGQWEEYKKNIEKLGEI